ncbi:DNA helicase RecD, partial [Streptomyces sp. SID339]|nr:DNA helicase RecD [Streptomyces sp. SID339]
MQGARRCVGAGAPLSRSRLEHAVSTEPAAAEDPGAAAAEEAESPGAEEAAPDAEATTDTGESKDEGESTELSEAEAEIAAQRELRERIEQRKASKQGPIEAGTKLSGTAADLLAAVRAVESGEKPVASAFQEPEPARRPAPARAP